MHETMNNFSAGHRSFSPIGAMLLRHTFCGCCRYEVYQPLIRLWQAYVAKLLPGRNFEEQLLQVCCNIDAAALFQLLLLAWPIGCAVQHLRRHEELSR